MKIEKIIINEAKNVILTAYLQATGGEFSNIKKRPAVLILPGGGYQMCSDREADPVAFMFLKAGFQVLILRYSVGKHSKWPEPLKDYDDAMELIRQKSEEWDIYQDKIAVAGFSAGGHLAACAAAISENKPDALILGYPVIDEKTIHGYAKTAPGVVDLVNSEFCPCFVFATRNDNAVPVSNTLKLVTALEENGISFECHIYGFGPHGVSTADNSVISPGSEMCSRVSHWTADCIEWLKDIFGDFGDGNMTEPACGAHVNGNWDNTLSVHCTMGHLRKNLRAVEIVSRILPSLTAASDEVDEGQPHVEEITENMTLRDILLYGNVSKEVVKEIDMQLRKIPNRKGV